MPVYTKLPKPEGHIQFSYGPMSPPNWGLVPFNTDVFVYSSVQIALQALMQAATTIHAQRLERGSAELFNEHIFFRGHSEVTQRLLPTRLRGCRREPLVRDRISIGAPRKVVFNGVEFPEVTHESGGEDPRDHWGDWYECVDPTRLIEDSLAELAESELHRRSSLEESAIERASQISEFLSLDAFRKRAAVRHYSGAPSSLLDVSTHAEVAAFFATGGASHPPKAGAIGMLWAIDLNFLANLFSLKTDSIPGGEKITLTEQRDKWGDNKAMFEDYGVLPTFLELASVELPFKRPQAQHARFLSLAGENAALLPPKTELTWWSIIERMSFACAFIHNGQTFENRDHNITAEALWPGNEPLANALA